MALPMQAKLALLGAVCTLLLVPTPEPAFSATDDFGVLYGTVYYDQNKSGQQDADEPLLANAQVSCALDLIAIGLKGYSTTADASGHWQLRCPAGRIIVSTSVHGGLGSTILTLPSGARVQINIGMSPPLSGPVDYFPQTGYEIEDLAFRAYFHARGGVDTFGYPVSATFRLLGFKAQIFQREVLQRFPDGSVHPMNLLDPGLFPVNTLNFSSFPTYDPTVATMAPPPQSPDYGHAVLDYLENTVPETWNGQPVGFLKIYLSAAPATADGYPPLLALEVYGFPTSRPVADPNNKNFVYQRFQRGILHYDATSGVTRGILLADAFKSLINKKDLPADVATDQRGSPFLDQYCPGPPAWLCRPEQVHDTDLTFAFEREVLG